MFLIVSLRKNGCFELEKEWLLYSAAAAAAVEEEHKKAAAAAAAMYFFYWLRKISMFPDIL